MKEESSNKKEDENDGDPPFGRFLVGALKDCLLPRILTLFLANSDFLPPQNL